MVSTAVVIWGETPPPPREVSNSQDVEQSQLCCVRLEVACRPALPHERADGRGLIGETRPQSDSFLLSQMTLHLADGSRLCVDSELLACSNFMRPLLLSHNGADDDFNFCERRTGVVSLAQHSADAVRGVVRWLQAAPGEEKRNVASQLLSPRRIVDVVRLCHFLDFSPPELYEAGLSVLTEDALDVSNAPSLLLLARELGAHQLEVKATDFIARRLDEVEIEAEDWSSLPKQTRLLVNALRVCIARPLVGGKLVCMPFNARGALVGDARELLAMLRESLDEQQERLHVACERYRDERALMEVDRASRSTPWQSSAWLFGASPPQNEQVCKTLSSLEAQAKRVESFALYVAEQQEAFARLLEPLTEPGLTENASVYVAPFTELGPTNDDASANDARVEDVPINVTCAEPEVGATDASGALIPSYEWQWLPDNCIVPPGLQVELPLDGSSRRRARIPPHWQLRVWINDALGFWRYECDRGTLLRDVYHAAVAELASGGDVRMSFSGEAIDDHEQAGLRTVEEARLFQGQAHLRIAVERTPSS